MAIVVLCIGGFLTLMGIGGYIYGLDLLPTERGVAGTISASVILVGGVLTVSIGLLLQRLEEMSRLLTGGRTVTAPAPVAVPETVVVAAPEPAIEAPAVGVPSVDASVVAIEAPKPAEKSGISSLKPAAIVAGAAVAGGIAAKAGQDAVEKALNFDFGLSREPEKPEMPVATPLEVKTERPVLPTLDLSSLETLKPREEVADIVAPVVEPVQDVLSNGPLASREHEVEYPVEVLDAPAEAPEPAKEAAVAADYAAVPMPEEIKPDPFDFEAELNRLLPVPPAPEPAAEVAAAAPAPNVEQEVVAAPSRRPLPKLDLSFSAKPAPVVVEPVPVPVVAEPEPVKSESVAEPAPAEVASPSEVAAPAPERAPEPESVPAVVDPVPTPAPGAEVIGAYESGGAKYTMYSDGSVIAETGGETLFFKSLEELRDFIDTTTKA